MSPPPVLSTAEIEHALGGLPGWARSGNALTRTYEFADFSAGVAFVARVAPVADEINHHPDVHIHWNTVELALWTHVSGGITARDLELARLINERVPD